MLTIETIKEIFPSTREKFEKVAASIEVEKMPEDARMLVEEAIRSYRAAFDDMDRTLKIAGNVPSPNLEEINGLYKDLASAAEAILFSVEEARGREGATA